MSETELHAEADERPGPQPAAPVEGGLWLRLGVPLTVLLIAFRPESPMLFTGAPFVASALAGFLEALVIGLTPDDKWDTRHNPASAHKSESGWPLALVLVLTVGVGAVGLIATIARTFDLLFTGGAYG